MKKKSSLFIIILFLCSLISILFYWLLYLEAIQSSNNKIKKNDLLKVKVEKRISELEIKLRENQNVLNLLNSKLKFYIQNNKYIKLNKSVFYYESNLCNISNNYEKNIFDTTIEKIYEELPFENLDGGVWKQGWEIKIDESKFTKANPLKIFVVPHSHNDPGWIKTFDQYFKQQTNLILNSMLKKLTEYDKMTFIWAEISYFSLWYDNLKNEDDKEMVKTLIDNGQLEIVTGGWVMNDEANTHYFSIISQLVEGHEWLIHNLNYKPTIGWAIDPFGVSSTMAFILKNMGFKAMVVQRVHYAIKKHLAKLEFLEFNWKQYWEKNNFFHDNDILCHIMPFYSYDIPHTCGPDPKICCQFDFKRVFNKRMKCPWKIQPKLITDLNVKIKSEQLLAQYKKKAMLFKTNSLLVPLGDDFRYENDQEWDIQYRNYQKLFDYINSHPQYNTKIQFSTLSKYFNSVFEEVSIDNNLVLAGDFFTYADKEDNYWSGYFISRPFYKRYNRILEYHLRAAEILHSFYAILNKGKNDVNSELSDQLIFARRSLALFQHHDGITGTAKNHVVEDYANKLFLSIQKTQLIISSLISSLFYLPVTSPLKPPIEFLESFPVKNMSYNHVFTLNKTVDHSSFILYNSLAKFRKELICLNIISEENWILRDPKGQLVTDVQINKLTQFNSNYQNYDEVCFLAKFKPLSIMQYSIELNSFKPNYEIAKLEEFNLSDNSSLIKEFSIESDKIRLIFDKDGKLKKFVNLEDNIEHLLDISFVMFGTRQVLNKESSGAYLFMPDSNIPKKIFFSNVKVNIIKGSIVSKVEIIFEDFIKIKHKIKLIKGQKNFNIQNEFFLKKLEFSNKELLMVINSNLKNKNVFYTDINAFQNVKRKFYSKIPLQGNVYPMPSLVYIEDEKTRFNLITGQPLGVTNPIESELYVFLDRLLLQDDFRGLGQGVTDNKPTRQIYQIHIEPKPKENIKSSLQTQLLVDRFLNPILQMKSLNQSSQGSIEFLVNELPKDVYLLNFRTNLNSYNNFYLFLHKYLVSCDTKKDENEFIKISKIFRKTILDVLNVNVDLMSLSMLNKVKDYNLMDDNLMIDQNSFRVLDLTLKN